MNFNFKQSIFNIILNAYSLAVIYFLALYFLGQSPDMDEIPAGPYLLNSFALFFGLGAVSDALLNFLKVRTLGGQLFARPDEAHSGSAIFWQTLCHPYW